MVEKKKGVLVLSVFVLLLIMFVSGVSATYSCGSPLPKYWCYGDYLAEEYRDSVEDCISFCEGSYVSGGTCCAWDTYTEICGLTDGALMYIGQFSGRTYYGTTCTASYYTCTDTDKSTYPTTLYTLAGTATLKLNGVTQNTKTDSCSGITLTEYYCVAASSSSISQTAYSCNDGDINTADFCYVGSGGGYCSNPACASGYKNCDNSGACEVCASGACSGGSCVIPSTYSCTDTDKDTYPTINYPLGGTVTVKLGTVTQNTQADYCFSSTGIVEIFCASSTSSTISTSDFSCTDSNKNTYDRCISVSGGSYCSFTACPSNYGDCDGSPDNGCEANLLTSTSNCGSCGNSCSGGTCVGGVCTGPCTDTCASLNKECGTFTICGVSRYCGPLYYDFYCDGQDIFIWDSCYGDEYYDTCPSGTVCNEDDTSIAYCEEVCTPGTTYGVTCYNNKLYYLDSCGTRTSTIYQTCTYGCVDNNNLCNPDSFCGDTILTIPLEACDSSASNPFNGATCNSLTAKPNGALDCVDYCSSISTSDCWMCGDGIIHPSYETCDGSNLNGKTCATQGFTGGTLSCNSNCLSFITSGCYTCGNGVCESSKGEPASCIDCCIPRTCSYYPGQCGTLSNGCSGTISCVCSSSSQSCISGTCQECIINTAYWDRSSAENGDSVYLTAGTNAACSGKTINFEIRRDQLIGSDYITTKYSTGGSSSASTSWYISGQSQGDYFFKASVSGGNTVTSGDLYISIPISCGDGTCNAGEDCSCIDCACTEGQICESGSCVWPCDLTNAYWSTTSTYSGSYVSLTTQGSNCNGKTIYFDIYRDQLIGRQYITSSSATMSSGSASTGWTASSTVGTYYFETTDDSDYITSNDLYVTLPPGCPDGSCNGGETCATCSADCGSCCGDGTLDSGETCDDGGTSNGDGCSSSCYVESGWECTGEPSNCWRSCGDGTLDSGEACDDGNTDNNDGCSSSCYVESGWECDNIPMPSSCAETTECSVSNAYWGESEVEEGTIVYLNIVTTNCDNGEIVLLSVKEEDYEPLTDDDVTQNPSSVVTSGNFATGTWNAEYQDDTDGNIFNTEENPPEYYFRAEIQSTGNARLSNMPDLIVVQSGGLFCIDKWNCGDYLTEGDCEADSCAVAGDSQGPGITCGRYFESETRCLFDTSCSCYWDSISGSCGPTYDEQMSCGECGNGVQDYTEQCDDGNTDNNDGCSSECRYEDTPPVEPPPCGEGLTLCEDNTCSMDCIITNNGFATCNYDSICDSGEGCTCSDCDGEQDTCKGGLLCSLEEDGYCCDSNSNDICNPNCASVDPDCGENVLCGNGLKEFGEQCDDGNSVSGDGCSPVCLYEDNILPPCPEGTALCNDGTCSLNCWFTDQGIGECDNGECCVEGLSYSLVDLACCNILQDDSCNSYCAYMDPDCGSGGMARISGIGKCIYSKNSNDNCDDGFLTRDYGSVWEWDITNVFYANPDPLNNNYIENPIGGGEWHYDPLDINGLRRSDRCQGISDELICPAQVKLDFFGKVHLIIAFLLITLIYVIVIFRKKK